MQKVIRAPMNSTTVHRIIMTIAETLTLLQLFAPIVKYNNLLSYFPLIMTTLTTGRSTASEGLTVN